MSVLLESIWLLIFHSKKHLCQTVHGADRSLADELPLQLQTKISDIPNPFQAVCYKKGNILKRIYCVDETQHFAIIICRLLLRIISKSRCFLQNPLLQKPQKISLLKFILCRKGTLPLTSSGWLVSTFLAVIQAKHSAIKKGDFYCVLILLHDFETMWA